MLQNGWKDKHNAAVQTENLPGGQETDIDIVSAESRASWARLKLGFKKIYGTAVYGYVRRLRIEEAGKLLKKDVLTVSKVAGELGYRSLSHFTVAFKREFLCTPSTYRKEHTGKHKVWGKRVIILKNSFTVNYLSKLNFASI